MEDPRLLVGYFWVFYLLMYTSIQLIGFKTRAKRIFSVALLTAAFDFLVKNLFTLVGGPAMVHVPLSFILLVILLKIFIPLDWKWSLLGTLVAYILLFAVEALFMMPALRLLERAFHLRTAQVLEESFWYDLWSLVTHLPLLVVALGVKWTGLRLFKGPVQRAQS